MKKLFDFPGEISLFRGISPDKIEAMLPCLSASVKTYRKNELVFQEGEPAVFVGVLLSGKVHIIKEDYYGNRSIIAEALSGEIFGEVFACANVASLPVTVIAAEDAKILLLDCRRIVSPCDKGCSFHRALSTNLLSVVAQKTLILSQKIDLLSKRSTREKLLSYLSSQAKASHCSTFKVSFSRQELADFLCVERSAMSAELSRMKKDGLIDYKRNRFKLL